MPRLAGSLCTEATGTGRVQRCPWRGRPFSLPLLTPVPRPSTMVTERLLEAGKTEALPICSPLSFPSPTASAQLPPTSSSHLKRPFPQGGAAETARAFIFILFYFFLTSLLEYNCFTMVCQFLLYNKMNQLYIYICPHISSLLRLPPTLPIPPL